VAQVAVCSQVNAIDINTVWEELTVALCNRISNTFEGLLFQNRNLDPNERKKKAKSSA